MVSYCNVMDRGVFATRSGHSIPNGMVALEAGSLHDRCERYGEIMTPEEAQQEGIRQGYLCAFRETPSFWHLAASFEKRGPCSDGFDPLSDLCRREEMDEAYVRATVKRNNDRGFVG